MMRGCYTLLPEAKEGGGKEGGGKEGGAGTAAAAPVNCWLSREGALCPTQTSSCHML